MRWRARSAVAVLAIVSAPVVLGLPVHPVFAAGQNAQSSSNEKELTGQVLRTQGNTIFVKGSGGAAVQIQVTGKTIVNGIPLERVEQSGASLRDQVQPGEDVTARFHVRRSGGELNNVASSVTSLR